MLTENIAKAMQADRISKNSSPQSGLYAESKMFYIS